MSLLQAYLRSPRTKRALSKKPGQQGFSLIELVIVVAVLAVLAVIAIPAFDNIASDGRTAAGKTALANAVKECSVSRARGGTVAHTALVDGGSLDFNAALEGVACTATEAVVCVENSTAAAYGVNLVNGTKLTSGSALSAAVGNCGASLAFTNW